MSDIDVNQVLAQMRAMAVAAQGKTASAPVKPAGDAQDFLAMVRSAVDKVNATQQQAGKLAQAFETGDANVDLASVMISMQKANISFQAMTQVRNKLVAAYQEIMNMQV